VAQKIINTLNGNPPLKIVPEKTQEEKEKQKFEKKKLKLKLKVALRDGYKCQVCSDSKEDSLCIIKKDKDNISYELENLVLKCRKCLRK
jgi:5-methylcytosine-specific restriction endonuclease McrA